MYLFKCKCKFNKGDDGVLTLPIITNASARVAAPGTMLTWTHNVCLIPSITKHKLKELM